MRAPNRNTAWASAFVDELARAGLRHACIAPGSRSTPLVLALAAEERIRCFVHVDERSAAFFALGIGKATGAPAAVVTTSGTATANLLPAAMEADASRAPLLLLTADRPARLHGTDANQTVDQSHLFGSRVRLFHQVAAPEASDRGLRYVRALAGRALGAALGPPAGPVHLDFPFDKPLEPTVVPGDVPGDLAERWPLAAGGRGEGRPFTAVTGPALAPAEDDLEELAGRLTGGRRTLLVCGPASGAPEADRLGRAALRLAAAGDWPLLADPLSGARFAPGAATGALGAYDLFLRSAELRRLLRPDVVLRLGPTPTSAALAAYLEEHADREQLVVDAGPSWADHVAVASGLLRADPAVVAARLADAVAGASPEPGWAESWRAAETAAREAARAEIAEVGGEAFEGDVLAAVADALPDEACLFVGSSMPVRDLDAFGLPRDRRLVVLGNRGASGIDGSVSTALGAAATRSGGGAPTVAVLGDLALYHDMNGLLAVRKAGVDIVLIVIHNDGGGIFHMLPVREYEPAFTPYFATPHGLDFGHAASMYGLTYREVGPGRAEEDGGGSRGGDRSPVGELREAVGEALAAGGGHLLIVRSARERNRELHERVAGAAIRAAERAVAESSPPTPRS
jgi:2-succinyl-5-enolpyruvyl-6-hydroxy-3-cyclohexene-1-carboxylate synthase